MKASSISSRSFLQDIMESKDNSVTGSESEPKTAYTSVGNVSESQRESGDSRLDEPLTVNDPESQKSVSRSSSYVLAHAGTGSDGNSGQIEAHQERIPYKSDHLRLHPNHPHFHLWTSHKLPHRSTEAHALARAEAASWAQMTPLIAATLGPLAVLLGIPSLTQHWQGLVLNPPVLTNGKSNYTALPNPSVNFVLAVITIVCEVLGNTLLVMRFSDFHTRTTTWASYFCWIIKIIIGITNCIQFGLTNPETENIIYLQGFWAGVCSMAVTMIIIISLTFNLAFLRSQSLVETKRLHHVQQEFMMQTLVFFAFTGICALIFSQVESITYLDGIYYIVVTTLTIGFGDVVPQTTSMKVLTFPCAVVGITLLAIIVTSIVRLLSDRARRTKLLMEMRLKEKVSTKQRQARHVARRWPLKSQKEKEEQMMGELTLQEEIQRLREEDWARERRSNIKSMLIGFTVFLLFWFIGALIFNFVEPWGYGNALYFCYIFFLTIGFGDLAPTSEAGRAIFIVYALLAVPTMTIVVQTVTSNFTSYMSHRFHRQKHQVYKKREFEIHSLNSLVKAAKERECKRVHEDASVDDPVKLPLHNLTERLMASLHLMHHQLQNLLLHTLGSDARNVITAERAREPDVLKDHLNKSIAIEENRLALNEECIPRHLNQIGQVNCKDELELLNEYRERYAAIIAGVLIAGERLLELEKDMKDQTTDEDFKRRLSEEMAQIGNDNIKEWRRNSLDW